MVEHKYIPVCREGVCYVFDTTNKWLYPCTQTIYDLFLSNSTAQLEKIAFNDKELKEYLDMLSGIEKQQNIKMISYPSIQRSDTLSSLSRVPNIILEITQKCNLSCVYCCYGNLYKQKRKIISESNYSVLEFLKVLIRLRCSNKVYSDFRITFYGGEPLLRMNLVKECVAFAKSSELADCVSFGMTTNGMLLDRYTDYLVENDFHLLISLDGNQQNDAYRVDSMGGESFGKVQRNVEFISEKYPVFFKNNVEFSAVLHGRNDIVTVVSYFSKWNKIPVFSEVLMEGKKRYVGKYKEIWKEHQYSEKSIDALKKHFPKESMLLLPQKDKIKEVWKNEFHDENVFLDRFLSKNNVMGPGNCFLFSARVFVSLAGDIYLCEKSSRKYRFGKIKNGKIWIYLKRINGYYKDIANSFKLKCVDCYKNSQCNCCFFSESEKISNQICFSSRGQFIGKVQNI